MSITSAKSGATGISLALENNFMEPVASTLLSSASGSVTFADIPQTYKHLQLRTLGQTTTGYPIGIRFNGDTSSNYVYHVLQGNSASVAAGVATAQTSIATVAAGGATTNAFGGGVIDILDYTNTSKYKITRGLTGYEVGTSGTVYFYSGLWMSNTPITSITLIDTNNGNMITNCRFSLYGIKG